MAAVRVEPRRQEAPLAAEIGSVVRNLDYVLVAAVAGLVAYGLWVLSAVSRNDVTGDPDYFVFRQSINVALGTIVLAVVTYLNPDLYRRLRKPLYVGLLVSLVVVFVFAEAIRGTRRWIDIGFFQLQPSELGKVVVILVLASFLAEPRAALGEWRTTLDGRRARRAPRRARLLPARLRDGDRLRGRRRGRALRRGDALVAPGRPRRGDGRARGCSSSGSSPRRGCRSSARTRSSASPAS